MPRVAAALLQRRRGRILHPCLRTQVRLFLRHSYANDFIVLNSTITSWGQAGEPAAFRNMLEQFPGGLIACVSDSYDIWFVYIRLSVCVSPLVCSSFASSLPLSFYPSIYLYMCIFCVPAHSPTCVGMRVPIFGAASSKSLLSSAARREDSLSAQTLATQPRCAVLLFCLAASRCFPLLCRIVMSTMTRMQVVLKCLSLLGEAFGTTVNSKGYKILPPYVRYIHHHQTILSRV